MGVTNYDNLPQNIAQTRLREAYKVAQQRKAAQRVSGSNVRYIRSGDDEFAWSGQIDTVSQQDNTKGLARFAITLTSNKSAQFLNDLVLEVYTSTDGTSWTRYTTRDYLNSVSPLINYVLNPAFPLGLTPYEAQWLVAFGSNLNAYMAFKVQALATDQVTIGVERML